MRYRVRRWWWRCNFGVRRLVASKLRVSSRSDRKESASNAAEEPSYGYPITTTNRSYAAGIFCPERTAARKGESQRPSPPRK
eukprot:6475471-Amphidinium_carterae.1